MAAPKAKHFRHVRELGQELVVVDEEHDVAHGLTPAAAAVWRACDGRSTPASIAIEAGLRDERVDEILGQLRALGLLEEPVGATGDTRRSMLRKAVLTGVGIGVGIPAVTSVLLPSPAQAFDSLDPGTPDPGTTAGTTVTESPTSPVAQSSASSSNPLTPTVEPARTTRSPGRTTHATTPTRTGRAPTRSGAVRGVGTGGTGSSTPVAGTGLGGRRTVPSGQLPFTGSRVFQSVAVGAGMLASGVWMRIRAAAPAREG